MSTVSLVTPNHAHCAMVWSCTVTPTWDPPREAVIYQVFMMQRRTESAKSAARPQSTHPSRVGGGAARRSVCVRDGEGRGRGPAGFEGRGSILLVPLAAQQPLAACSAELLRTPAGARPLALDECLQASCSSAGAHCVRPDAGTEQLLAMSLCRCSALAKECQGHDVHRLASDVLKHPLGQPAPVVLASWVSYEMGGLQLPDHQWSTCTRRHDA